VSGLLIGVAEADITPPHPVPLAGFGSRSGVFEGVDQPLALRAFWFSTDDAHALLVVADMLWWPPEQRDALRAGIAHRWPVPAEHVILHATHTHGSPQSSTVFAPGIGLADEAWGCDMEGEIACITGDVPMGCSVEEAASHIRLLMLVNDVSLRGLIPAELEKGFGFFQSKPASAFSPVAVTPDELGDAWQDALIHLPLMVDYNGKPFGRANAGVDATFNLAQLVAHAAKTRNLCAGTIIGTGTISNKGADGGPGKPVAEGGAGYSCIAEIRMIETIRDGQPATPFMQEGDTVRIEMRDAHNHSIFGAIEQRVVAV